MRCIVAYARCSVTNTNEERFCTSKLISKRIESKLVIPVLGHSLKLHPAAPSEGVASHTEVVRAEDLEYISVRAHFLDIYARINSIPGLVSFHICNSTAASCSMSLLHTA